MEPIHPLLNMILQPPGYPPTGLGFRLPSVPGIPDPHSTLSAGLRIADESAVFAKLPQKEVQVTLAAVSETLVRSRYHKLRFDECKLATQLRREALGGPVVWDWHLVSAMVWEASACLGAARTGVDLLVYLAARRGGKSESAANGWQAGHAIAPKHDGKSTPPTRYDVPEIMAIRAHNPWFDRLNLYRNVIFHRGLGGNKWGYYSKSDTAEEASSPIFNAMLLPDEGPLRNGTRAHAWTYNDGNRLDDFLDEMDLGFGDILHDVLTNIWQCPLPAEGTVPREERPNAIMRLPMSVAIEYPDCRAVPIFETKTAAMAFKFMATQQLALRAVRPTRIGTDAPCFLLPVPPGNDVLPWRLHIYGMSDGVLTRKAVLDANPQEGPIPHTIAFRAVEPNALPVVYVWQPQINVADDLL